MRHEFPGKRLLNALIDLPLAVSPVVVGLALILVYGTQHARSAAGSSATASRSSSPCRAWCSPPCFVSLPLVVRAIVPVLEEMGDEQEQAAHTLGAASIQTFRRITLPAIRWALAYGIVLCLARALGEFGAVAVVSGRIVGQTQTLTLYVEQSYENFDQAGRTSAAFALWPLIAILALLLMTVLRPEDPTAPRRALTMAIEVRQRQQVVRRDAGARRRVRRRSPSGSLTALLGPSGGGKSTLLRVIAGLEKPDTGVVELDGVDATQLPPQRRNVGFVFQHYAAFKHMTRLPQRRVRAGDPQAARRPRSASGSWSCSSSCTSSSSPTGARAAVRRPAAAHGARPGARRRAEVLLLDEPFGALDAQVRKELRTWLRRLHDEVHVTTVFVTHDQEEAMDVADRIVVLAGGRVEQVGSPTSSTTTRPTRS